MKQIALSIEQMKHLESLGLDTSDASMYYMKGLPNSLTYRFFSRLSKEDIPAYTLQDVLSQLPKFINIEETPYSLVINFDSCSIYYMNTNEYAIIQQIIFNKTTFLTSAYQMLLWCIKNGYIKTK